MPEASSPLPLFAALPRLALEGAEVTARGVDPGRLHVALREEAAVLALEPRALLRIAGEEAADLLHRVATQDARGMLVGGGAPACFLSGRGKLLATCELFRPEAGVFVAETDRGQRGGLRDLLDRYIFTEHIALEELPFAAVGVFGPAVPRWLPEAPAGAGCCGHRGGILLASAEFGVPGVRFHGPADEAQAFASRLAASGLPLGGFLDLEALRIDAGMPRYGVDADATTIPLEVNLGSACHPDKGCYVGQEIIARIRTYGHVNRQLCRLLVESDACPPAGTRLFHEEVEAGRLTSGYVSPVDGRLRALGMLPSVLAASGVELRCGSARGARVLVL